MTRLLQNLTTLTSGIAFAAPDADAGGGGAPAPETETKTVLRQNDIKRPDSGSVTGKMWDIADEISTAKNAPATRKEVVDRYLAEVPNANSATANTQYARWVTFHGVTDVLRKMREEKTAARREAKEAEKAIARAEAEAKKAETVAEAEAKKAETVAEAEVKKAAKEAEAAQKKAEKEAAKAAKAAEKEAAKAAKAAEKEAKAEVDANATDDQAA